MTHTEAPRVLLAAERACLASQRSSIAPWGVGFLVERFWLFLEMETRRTVVGGQRSLSWFLGAALMLLGGAVALASARQFYQFAKIIQCGAPGYWSQAGVGLNLVITTIAMALRMHTVGSPR